jgi:hypothetical protein
MEVRAPTSPVCFARAQAACVPILTMCLHRTGIFFWPPINLIRFAFVPLQWRAATGSLAAAVWGAYMASVSQRAFCSEELAVEVASAQLTPPTGSVCDRLDLEQVVVVDPSEAV